MDETRRETTLHDETAELRTRGESLVEMQRVVIARQLRERADVLRGERQATGRALATYLIEITADISLPKLDTRAAWQTMKTRS